jgi:hypothetical protein
MPMDAKPQMGNPTVLVLSSSGSEWDGGRPVALEDLRDALEAAPGGSVALVAQVGDIDDRLVDLVQSVPELAVGILPFRQGDESRIASLLTPDQPPTPDTARVCVYSVYPKDLKFNPPEAVDGIDLIVADESNVRRHLLEGLDAFAGSTHGRQTYCSLSPDALLHPSIQPPPDHVLVPSGLNCRHWFLQSCHSPFVWRDFGRYLTLPQALLLTGNARTFIASVRMQTFIPSVLQLYVRTCAEGRTLGEIVLMLNEHSRRLGVDDQPFVLFGNPSDRVVRPTKETPSLRPPADQVVGPRYELLRVAKLLSGLQELTQLHLARRKDAQSKRFVRTVRSDLGRFSNLGIALQSIPRASEATDLRDVVKRYVPWLDLQARSRELLELWRAGRGYHYTYADDLEAAYVPTGCRLTRAVCLACGSVLRERRLRGFSLETAASARRRRQLVCPRCLVVRDSPYPCESTAELERVAEGLRATVRHTNGTATRQWVMAASWVNDPNNVSVDTARQTFRELIKPIDVTNVDSAPRTLDPGDTVTWTACVEKIPKHMFYLLLEVHAFVDFAWHWYSFTWRDRSIEAWLDSDIYRRSLGKTR